MKAQILKDLPVTDFLSNAEVMLPSDSISKVIGRMHESPSFEAFVQENGRTSIVTALDILNVRDITSTKTSNVMRFIPRLSIKSTVSDATALMIEYRIKSLPVYENSILKGIISARPIVEKLMETDSSEKINNIMTPNPVCLSKSDETTKARQVMITKKIDQLPILEDQRLFGVVTSNSIALNTIPSTDRMAKGRRRPARFDVPVEDFAEPDVITNNIKDSLKDVFRTMTSIGGQYSVITNFDEVQGIITYHDFMRLLMSRQDLGFDTFPMYMVGLPKDPFEAEAAKEKFTRAVSLLRKAHPEITEARAIIKSGRATGNSVNRRYEVHVHLKSPRQQFNYGAFGFSLPEVFDVITGGLKKRVAREDRPRKGRRIRPDPGSFA